MNENRLAPKTGGNNIRTATTDTNITYIEYCKDQRASVFAKEIQKEMIKNQVCLSETVPSRASISRALNKILVIHISDNTNCFLKAGEQAT